MKRPIQVFNFSIKNAGNDTVDIHIDGDIVDASTQELLKSWMGDDTSVSFKSFRNQVNEIDAKTYNIYINTYGGIITDAMAMHDFLTELETKGKTVNRIGRGIVASSGTYILMGNNASMTKNSWMMIHNVSGGVYGDVDTVENYAATLRKFNNRSRDFYAEFTNMRKEDISKLMNTETWMTADEAFEKGFIKNVIGAQAFSNSIPKENWQFSNMAVLNAYNAAVKPPVNTETSIDEKFENMKKYLTDLGTSIMNAIKGIKAPENNDHGSLMSSIGEAVSNSFANSAEQMETSVQEVVNASLKSDGTKKVIESEVSNAVTAIDFSKDGPAKTAMDNSVKIAVDNAIKTAVENATKEQNTKIEALEKKNTDLETEITNLKGKPTNSGKQEETGYVAKGRLNKVG